jgi:hypothetical protein
MHSCPNLLDLAIHIKTSFFDYRIKQPDPIRLRQRMEHGAMKVFVNLLLHCMFNLGLTITLTGPQLQMGAQKVTMKQNNDH